MSGLILSIGWLHNIKLTNQTQFDDRNAPVLISGISVIQVTNLRARGVQFLDVPDKYYTNLKERLKQSPINVEEDIDMVSNGRTTPLTLLIHHSAHP